MRENPNQAYHGALFGMSQGNCSNVSQMWIKQDLFLKRFLWFANKGSGQINGYEVQKLHYSGKKGYHTLKNLLMKPATTLEGEVVLYPGETFEGSHHDKALYDQAELVFYCPAALSVGDRRAVDLGFLGIEAEGVRVFIPEKRPKGQELTQYQKELNSSNSYY